MRVGTSIWAQESIVADPAAEDKKWVDCGKTYLVLTKSLR